MAKMICRFILFQNQTKSTIWQQLSVTVASLYTIVTSFLSIKYYFQQTHCDQHCEHVLCWYPRIEIGVTSAVSVLGLKSKLYSMSIKLSDHTGCYNE